MSVVKIPFVFLLLFLPVLSLAAEPKVYYWSVREDYFHPVDFSKSPDERFPKEEFDEQEKTVVLIHGFAESIHRGMYRDFARRVKQFEPKTNILGIDWSESQNVSWLPGMDPVSATSFVPDVANRAYKKLFSYKDGLNLCAPKMHIIGFSHGAHIAAMIGKHAGGNIDHLTFLDPSPAKSHLFSWENFLGSGWSVEQSARFCDLYKSSNWTSTSQARGHVCFYVWENGIQPGASPTIDDIICILLNIIQWKKPDNIDDIYKNHYYAFHWYLSTIGKNNDQFGYSITKPDQKPQRNGNFKTINSSLPKKYNSKKSLSQNEYSSKDYSDAESFLVN